MSRHTQLAAERGRSLIALVIGAAALAAVFASGFPGSANSAPARDPGVTLDRAVDTRYGAPRRTCRKPKRSALTLAYRRLQSTGWTQVRYRGTRTYNRRCLTVHQFTACRRGRLYRISNAYVNGRNTGFRSRALSRCRGHRHRPSPRA